MTDAPWYVWLGNPGMFPYLIGMRKPIACCTEDARPFRSREEAEDEIVRHEGGVWSKGWHRMQPIQ